MSATNFSNILLSFLFVFAFPSSGTALKTGTNSAGNCGARWITIQKDFTEKESLLLYDSYGETWVQRRGDIDQLVIWVKPELLNDLINKLQQDKMSYSISQAALCTYARDKYPVSQIDARMNYKDTAEPKLLKEDLPSVNIDLIIDYGDGTIYSNLFYSLKVVTSSDTKRFTLGEKNYFILGSLRSRKGLWSFEESETDGLYLLRNRAALKYNEVIYDDKCFSGQTTKPCLTYNQYSSESLTNPLRFRLTNTDSTGIHIYVNDGTSESCLEYVEQSKGLVQVATSDDNTTCAIFIPTLKSKVEHERMISVVSTQQEAQKLTLIDWQAVVGDVSFAVSINSTYNYDNLSEHVSVIASYSQAKASNLTYNEKDLTNVVSHLSPEVTTCNLTMDGISLQCEFNQLLNWDIGITVEPHSEMTFDTILTSYGNLKIEFSETSKMYMNVDVLLKCETFPCTRVLQQRLPDKLVKAIGGSETVKTRSGTAIFSTGYTILYRILKVESGNPPNEHPTVCS